MRKFFLIFFNILRIVTIFLRLHNILDLISDLFLYFEYEVSLRTVHPQRQYILSDSSSSETVHPQRQFILSDSSSSVTVHPQRQFILKDSSSWVTVHPQWQFILRMNFLRMNCLRMNFLRMNCFRMNCHWGWTVFEDELSQDKLSLRMNWLRMNFSRMNCLRMNCPGMNCYVFVINFVRHFPASLFRIGTKILVLKPASNYFEICLYNTNKLHH